MAKKEKPKKKEKKETAMSIAYRKAMLNKRNKKGSLGQKGQPFQGNDFRTNNKNS